MQKLDRTGTASRLASVKPFAFGLDCLMIWLNFFFINDLIDLTTTSFICSITGSLGTPTLPTAPILGAAPAVSPAIAPLLSGSVLAIPGLPVAGLQLPATTIPTVETIGVPSDCILLKNMFDPKKEVRGLSFFRLPDFSAFVLFCLGSVLFWQTEPDFDLDIKEDVQEECSRFGSVKHIHVDK
jgi:RNA-binding protein 39